VIASPPVATTVISVATDSSSPEAASIPAAVAPTPAPASNGWSFWLLIVFGVLVVVVGTMFPFLNRWRKQKKLEGTDAPNLSFNRDVNSDQGESDKKGPRKAA
jgi:heme/copper-type cytochrome/quinol oxidase subunit 2